MSFFSSIVLSPGLLLDSIITYSGHDTALAMYISISVVICKNYTFTAVGKA